MPVENMDIDEKEEKKEEKKQDSSTDEKKESATKPKRKKKNTEKQDEEDLDAAAALNEEEIRLMKAYSTGPYDEAIKALTRGVKNQLKGIEKAQGIQESDLGHAPPSLWDLNSDKRALQEGV